MIDEQEKMLRGQIFYSQDEAIAAVVHLLNFKQPVGPPHHEVSSFYHKIDCGWIDDTAICLLYLVHQESNARNQRDSKSTGRFVVLRFYEFMDASEIVSESRYDLPKTRQCFRISTLCAITRKSGSRPGVRSDRLSARDRKWVEGCIAEARKLRKSLYLRFNMFEFDKKMQEFAAGIDMDLQKRSPEKDPSLKKNRNDDFCPFAVEPPPPTQQELVRHI